MALLPLERKTAAYIAERKLLSADGAYLCALSGGADSVCLLRVLSRLGYRIEAAHCNFRLRGAESDRDERFCRDLCGRTGVKLHVAGFDTRLYARERSVSVEMAARELRYGWFERILKERRLDGVCVAHHRNDSAETLLLNLVRGTGVGGLKGIAPVSGNVIRPLLCATRGEITAYLGLLGQEYVTDSSNLKADVGRNVIRLEVMPLLEKLNPAASENIAKTAERVGRSLELFNTALREAARRVSVLSEGVLSIDTEKLLLSPSPEIVLWELLRDRGFSPAQIEGIFAAVARPGTVRTGKEWSSATHTLVVDRGRLLVGPLTNDSPAEIVAGGAGLYSFDGCEYSVSFRDAGPDFRVIKSDRAASVDAGKVEFPLLIRRVREGDFFIPFGMTGRKLLSDYLTDLKVPLFDRRRQAVVVDAPGRIVWVAGRRTDNRFRITGETEKALVVTVKKIEAGKD